MSRRDGAPYGSRSAGAQAPTAPAKRVRTQHLREMKERGERFAMLTAYDMYTAQIFDEAGIEVLLVGDSASNNVYGNETSLPVTVDELIPLTRAVSRSVKRSLVVGDLPFGSYQRSPEQAYDTAVRFMKEGGAHAVKLEGGREMVAQIELLSRGGVPVMAHIGFTPQSEHALGGYRVQGRGDTAERIIDDARAVEAAGAFAVVMEMVPGDVAGQVTKELAIPTIGIGAGVDCDGQVLVWQDAFGLRGGRMARFVKQYADVRGVLLEGAQAYADEVRSGSLPRRRTHLLTLPRVGAAPSCDGVRLRHADADAARPRPRGVEHRGRLADARLAVQPTPPVLPAAPRSVRCGDPGTARAAATTPALRVTTGRPWLDIPWDVKPLTGGRLLITERTAKRLLPGARGHLHRVGSRRRRSGHQARPA